MSLRPANEWIEAGKAGSWPLPNEPLFAAPDAYYSLLHDLRRYTREEVTGRSYLIAGHRGAGKTALVLQALRRLRNLALLESVEKPSALLGRRGRPQRPLMVKMVGQSLIAAPPHHTEEEQLAEGMADPGDPGSPRAGRALVNITIALYRALASEVAASAINHARADRSPLAAQRKEVATQLAVMLDGGPDTGQLRQMWSLMGRLTGGLLWPAEAFDADRTNASGPGHQYYMDDQGYREILAVSTAAQAFQICSGTLTSQNVVKEDAEAKRTLNISHDLARLVGNVTSVLAGAATGVALAVGNETPAVSAGAGVLVWLLAAASFKIGSSRSSSRVQSIETSFLRDRTIQTLDRELPLVIDRIRDAGLAPVFIIDELDKLGDQTSETIRTLIDRLKHLLADHGFFCFLTDRDYFDQICLKIETEAYPTEHTYFSRRVLVTQRPASMVEYLKRLLVNDPFFKDDEFPRAVFALAVAYRSKLNFADVGRAIDYFVSVRPTTSGPSDLGEQQLKINANELRSRLDLRLAATIQLAIEEVLHTEPYQGLFEHDPDPAFIQLAMDALFIIPRAWEADLSKTVDISRAGVEAALLKRMGSSGKKTPLIKPADLDAITDMVALEADFLGCFATLKNRLSAAPELAAPQDENRLLHSEIVLSSAAIGAAGLVQRVSSGELRFLLDENAITVSRGDDARIDPAERHNAPHQRALVKALGEVLWGTGLTVEDMRRVDLLPRALTDEAVASAPDVLATAGRTWVRSKAFDAARTSARDLEIWLVEYGIWSAAVLMLVQRIVRDAKVARLPITSAKALQAISRYVSIPSTGSHDTLSPELITMLGNYTPPAIDSAAGLAQLRSNLDRILEERPTAVAERLRTRENRQKVIDETWEKRRTRVLDELGGHSNGAANFYEDILLNALDLPPGNLFRANLKQLTIEDWSAIVRAAAQTPGRSKGPKRNQQPVAPRWAGWLAMRKLGFPSEIVDEQFSTAEVDELMRDNVPARESASQPGILIVQQSANFVNLSIPVGRSSVLTVLEKDIAPYAEVIRAWADAGAFRGAVRERGGSKSASQLDSFFKSLKVPVRTLPRGSQPFSVDEISSLFDHERIVA